MTEKPQDKPAEGRKKRRVARKVAAAGTVAAVYFGGPYVKMVTDSYELEPMTPCDTYSSQIIREDAPQVEAAVQAMSDIFDKPASVNTLLIQTILDNGGTKGRINQYTGGQAGIEVTAEQSAHSTAYDESCETRGILQDVRMFNPVLYNPATYEVDKENPDNYLTFRALANYEDEVSANKAIAYYHEATGTLLIGTVGRTGEENYDRAIATISSNTERAVPFDFMDNFLSEVKDQLRSQQLKVNNTAILGHSLGVIGAVTLKGMIESSHANQVIFGKDPSLTLLEGFGESFAADAVTKRFDLSFDKLTRHSVSIRSGGAGEANIIGSEWGNNQTIGRQVYAVSAPEGEESHTIRGIAYGLLDGEREVTPFSGEFSPDLKEKLLGEGAEVLGKLAQAGRVFRQHTGLG